MRRRLIIAAVALLVPVAVVQQPTVAAAAVPLDGGIYTLANASSGKCLEVAGGSVDNGALLQQAACDAAATRQQWKIQGRNLVNAGSTRCADVPSSSTVSGTQL